MSDEYSDEREHTRYQSLRRNLDQHYRRQASEADARAKDMWENDPLADEEIGAVQREADDARAKLSQSRRDFLLTKRRLIKS